MAQDDTTATIERESVTEEVSACGNCGSAVQDDFCRVCGQPRHLHRSLTGVWHDFVHGVLHLDGKLMRTLPLLTFKPGILTRRYIEGKRRRFVSPMGMFLFSVFALFLVIQVLGIRLDKLPPEQRAFSALYNAELALRETLATIGTEEEVDPGSAIYRSPENDSPTLSDEERIERAESTLIAVRAARQAYTPDAPIDEIEAEAAGTALERISQKVIASPEAIIAKAQANSYKFSWLLIPLSVPSVWLLFPFSKRFNLYDHTMVVTYSLAFAGLFSTVLLLVSAIGVGAEVLTLIFFAGMVVHHLLHLKQFYRSGWVATVVRLFLLELFVAIILGIFLVILFAMGVVG